MKRLLLMLALLPALSMADYDVKVMVGLYTLHAPGICDAPQGFECDPINTDNDLIVLSFDNVFFGHMTNSYFHESWIVGVKHTERLGRFDLTAGLLLATGYPKYLLPGGKDADFDNLGVLAGAMANVAYNFTPNWSVELTTQMTALSFGIGYRL